MVDDFYEQSVESLNAPQAADLAALQANFVAGEHANVEALARSLIDRWPDHPAAWIALGAVLGLSKRTPEAVSVLQRAVQLSPQDAEAHNNLGTALWSLGRIAEAEASYLRALSTDSSHQGAQVNLASLLLELRRVDEAEALYRRALQGNRYAVAIHFGLGDILLSSGRISEAEEYFARVIQLKPDYFEAYGKRGAALRSLGRLKDAEETFRQALLIRPGSAETLNDLGVICREQGKLAIAEDFLRQALRIRPDFPLAFVNLGNLFWEAGRLSDAESCYRTALNQQANLYDALSNLGTLLRVTGRSSEAEVAYGLAIASRPDSPDAHNNLGNAIGDLGRIDEARLCYQRALELRPDYANARSNLLYLTAYRGLGSAEEYLVEAKQWEVSVVPANARRNARQRKLIRTTREKRRLRIGYVSGDFRSHPVSMFMEPIIEWHDRSKFEVFAYSALNRPDAVTERIREKAGQWCELAGLSDEAAASLVLEHEIDVLVDLSGHTNHNRLGLFARRAAPVQCHYLGYFASTGVSQIDYWIGDAILIPEAMNSHYSETIWRLPRCWVSYRPPSDAPLPDWRPDAKRITRLGSFNNLAKITPKTMDLWAEVLRTLADAHLFLKTKELNDPGNRIRIEQEFARRGITAERLELQGASVEWPAHMRQYDRMDIALDPVGGVGGGTTTCEALWMSVPLVTLCGTRHAERMTASMLSAVGHPELIAMDADEYVQKIVQLAKDSEKHRALRKSLHETMRRSTLCDWKGMARELERAYETMFDNWFEKQELRKSKAGNV